MDGKLKKRYIILCLGFVAFFFIIIFRLFNLQIVEGEKYIADSQRKILKEVDIEAPRGKILDRYGVPIAVNRQGYAIYVSKQTNNYSLERIAFLESIGIQRIILARELSLKQIKYISDNTKAELESFVHGALCVSYSGQCYMSHALFNRSANRGECAQPCRLKYSLEDNKGNIISREKYLLSLKDLNLSNHIEELADAGISSFKIEGRLKDISYVKNVTAFYRKKMDALLQNSNRYQKASSGRAVFDFEPDPERTFNRGFSTYFINNRGSNMASINTPKSIGKYIGKIKDSGQNYFVIEKYADLNNGDGVCYFDNNGDLTGFNITKTESGKYYFSPKSAIQLKKGITLYRNNDIEFEKKLNKSFTKRLIDIQIKIVLNENNLAVTLIDEDGNEVFEKYILSNRQLISNLCVSEVIEKQFRKTGGTSFNVDNISITVNKESFITISEINSLRRDILEKLELMRGLNYPKLRKKSFGENLIQAKEIISYKENIVNKLSAKLYQKYGAKEIQKGVEVNPEIKNPELMICKYCIKKELKICPLDKDSDNKVNGPMFLSTGNKRFKLIFDCKNCEMKITN